MAPSPYDTVAEKVLIDLELAIRKDPSINEFDIVPVSETENKNSSPILRGECSLGLESWIIPHIYPFAHNQIMQKSNYKTQNLEKVISCLSAVALLNPEMSVVWSRRRELILSKRMQPDNELRLTRMTLSRKPKSNEALSHRRWIITEMFKNECNRYDLLQEELSVSEMIANRYHSNYHAWSHRIWSFQQLLSDSHHWNFKKKLLKSAVCQNAEFALLFNNVPKVKFVSMVDSPTFQIYADELENNLKWVSCHVSDHSGFHFRKFLINEIFEFLKISLCPASNTSENEETLYNSIQGRSENCFLVYTKVVLIEFIKTFKNDSFSKKAVEEYLVKLEKNCTLFDLIFSVIVSELKSNYSLCLMFPGHEALWYYRRCLVYFLKQYVLDILVDSEQGIISHQDKNGVPHRKDFKYDYTLKADYSKLNMRLSDFLCTIYKMIIKNEEDLVMTFLKSPNENETLVRNYENWLKLCLKKNDTVF